MVNVLFSLRFIFCPFTQNSASFSLLFKLLSSPIGTSDTPVATTDTTLQVFAVTFSPNRWNRLQHGRRTRLPNRQHRPRPTWSPPAAAERSEWTFTYPTNIPTQAPSVHQNSTVAPPSVYVEQPFSSCRLEATDWSECSTSCGTGLSTRLSNYNAGCRMQLEVRLCNIRPCQAVYTQVKCYLHKF